MKLSIPIGDAVLELTRSDITEEATDAVVNAANSGLMGGGGVDGAIHRAAGPGLKEECRRIVARQGRLPPGQAVITSAGRMKAKHVIHTVGPIYSSSATDPRVLADCYRNSLALAEKQGLTSVAFPSISTGAYGYPLDEAAPVAIKTVADFLETESKAVKLVRFVLFNDRAYDAYKQAAETIRRDILLRDSQDPKKNIG